LFWLFWRWGVSQIICLGWPWTVILLILAFQVARITDMSHWLPEREEPLIDKLAVVSIKSWWAWWYFLRKYFNCLKRIGQCWKYIHVLHILLSEVLGTLYPWKQKVLVLQKGQEAVFLVLRFELQDSMSW
jgi:hypothetical protein